MRPGIVSKTSDGKIQCKPIFSRIVSLFAEQNELQYAVPGGLIGEPLASFWSHLTTGCLPALLVAGVGTKIDPTLCRADRLVGQVPVDVLFVT